MYFFPCQEHHPVFLVSEVPHRECCRTLWSSGSCSSSESVHLLRLAEMQNEVCNLVFMTFKMQS